MIIFYSALLGLFSYWLWYLWYFWKKTGKSSSNFIPEEKGYPIIGILSKIFKSDQALTLEKLALKHGPIFKAHVLGQEIIFVSGFNDIKMILKERPETFQRSQIIIDTFKFFKIDGLFTLTGHAWRRSRQVTAPAYTNTKLNQMKPAIIEHIYNLRSTWMELATLFSTMPKGANREEDIPSVLPSLQRAALRIISDISFADGQERLFDETFLNDLNSIFDCLGKFASSGLPISISRLVNGSQVKHVASVCDRLRDKIEDLIGLHKDKKGSRRTILHSIISTSDQSQKNHNDDNDNDNDDYTSQRIIQKYGQMDLEEIKANTAILVLAGYETTSTALTWLLHHISSRPDIQKAMRDEVASVFGHVDSAKWSMEVLEQTNFNEETFPFIQAVIREAFRLNPPSVLLGEECLKPVTVCGKDFPSGTRFVLMTRLAGLLESTKILENPYDFDPTRWLKMDEDTKLEALSYFLGFGGGSRICPGRYLANMEMIMIVSIIFTQFKIERYPYLPYHLFPVQAEDRFTNCPSNLFLKLTKL